MKSKFILTFGVLSSFLSPSVLLNALSLKYMWNIHSLLSDTKKYLSGKEQSPDTLSIFITGQTKLETKSDPAQIIEKCVYGLHCSAFTLFGLSFVSRETHNMELLLETLPQLILQLYMVFHEASVAKDGFVHSLEIPGWRIVGFMISFLSIGNAMRSAVVGKWEYYYFESNREEEAEILEPIIYTYPIPAQIANLLAHSCIIGSTALGAAHIFLQNVWIGFALIIFILLIPFLRFLFKKYLLHIQETDLAITWQNRYMWFFTESFSLLEAFNPTVRSSLASFSIVILVRAILYSAVLVLLYLINSDSFTLSLIVLATLGVGSICMYIERVFYSYHVGKHPFVYKKSENSKYSFP